MSEEVVFPLPESTLYKMQDELRAAQDVQVPYREDQLQMAHATINQMRLHVSRVLERLNLIESGEHIKDKE